MQNIEFASAVNASGNPANPPLLFLHGVRLAGSIWDEHAQALRDDFHVLTPDLPGHGTLAHLPFEAPVLNAFLNFVSTQVATRPPLIIGYSLGGYVAMRYALDMPEHTAGLVLAGCTADMVGARQRAYDMLVWGAAAVPRPVMECALATAFRLTMPPNIAERIIPYAFNPRVFAASRKIACGERYSKRLEQYTKPVMIINGEWDVLFRRDEAMFAKSARAAVHILAGAAHIAPLSRASQFSTLVRGFATSIC